MTLRVPFGRESVPSRPPVNHGTRKSYPAGSALEVSTDLSRLFRRQLPAGVGDALPALISQPLANGSVADTQLSRELLRGNRLGHILNLVAERPRREGRFVALASGRVIPPQ